MSIDGLISSTAGHVALVKELYGDLAKPAALSVGRALQNLIELGALPLATFSDRRRLIAQHNLEKLRKELEKVNPANISEVPPEIGMPVLEKLSFVSDEVLSQLFVNLLAKAADREQSHLAHPSFANIISNLSPDEGLLLIQLADSRRVPFIDGTLIRNSGEVGAPVDTLHLSPDFLPTLTFPNNYRAYLSNLEGLGIIRIRRDVQLSNASGYAPMEKEFHSKYKSVETAKASRKAISTRGVIEVTEFGLLFTRAVRASDS